MNLEDVKKAQEIIDINRECDRLWGGLKHHDLPDYLEKMVQKFIDKGYKVAVLIVGGIHESRREKIEDILKSCQFALPTEIIISFMNGSELRCRFKDKI